MVVHKHSLMIYFVHIRSIFRYFIEKFIKCFIDVLYSKKNGMQSRYLTSWDMVARTYHIDVGLGCDNMNQFDSIASVVRYNMYELFWEWQCNISYCSYNPHKMYVTTEKYVKSMYEYSCVASDVFRLVDCSDEWADLMLKCDELYRIMCNWLSQARANAYDSISRDTDICW